MNALSKTSYLCHAGVPLEEKASEGFQTENWCICWGATGLFIFSGIWKGQVHNSLWDYSLSSDSTLWGRFIPILKMKKLKFGNRKRCDWGDRSVALDCGAITQVSRSQSQHGLPGLLRVLGLCSSPSSPPPAPREHQIRKPHLGCAKGWFSAFRKDDYLKR